MKAVNPFKDSPLILQLLEEIEKALRQYMDSDVYQILEIGNYIFDGGGKRLRPLLTLLVAKGGKADTEKVLPLAVGLEYIHTASLLHDDVVDEAETRRGKKAAHKVFGNGVTVLTGDYMYANALYLFSTHGTQKMIEVVSDAVKKMAEGQILELKSVGELIDEETYFKIIDGKTGVLFAAAAAVGALASNLKESYKDFWNFGLSIGRAFQLIDDALDYIGDEKEVGKPVGLDLTEGKTTYPLLSVIENLETHKVKHILLHGTKEDIESLIQQVRELGGVERTKERARKEINRAREILEDSNLQKEEKELLNQILDFIVERTY
jgi:octaprenyl-diphosphate synthase